MFLTFYETHLAIKNKTHGALLYYQFNENKLSTYLHLHCRLKKQNKFLSCLFYIILCDILNRNIIHVLQSTTLYLTTKLLNSNIK